MTQRSTGMDRRQFLRVGSTVPLAAAGVGLGASAATGSPVRRPHGPRPIDGAIDHSQPGTPLLTNTYLTCVRTVMQSFAVDPQAGHVYVLQIVQANTPLPGDEPGDEAYARRTERGDLALTKLDRDGNRLGHMYLKHFGHGVSMGLEREGDQVHLWTEIDTLPNASGDGRGSRLTRFPFSDSAVLDAERDASLLRRELIPGATETTCNIDPVNNRLVMRYLGDGEFRYALFDLDHVKAERSSYQALFDVGTPAEVDGTFQGYASLGDHLYMMVGNGYSTDNPPPPEGTGNAALTTLRWSTEEVEAQSEELSGLDLHRREPEGLTVAIVPPGRSGNTRRGSARLYSGRPAPTRAMTLIGSAASSPAATAVAEPTLGCLELASSVRARGIAVPGREPAEPSVPRSRDRGLGSPADRHRNGWCCERVRSPGRAPRRSSGIPPR